MEQAIFHKRLKKKTRTIIKVIFRHCFRDNRGLWYDVASFSRYHWLINSRKLLTSFPVFWGRIQIIATTFKRINKMNCTYFTKIWELNSTRMHISKNLWSLVNLKPMYCKIFIRKTLDQVFWAWQGHTLSDDIEILFDLQFTLHLLNNSNIEVAEDVS